MLIKRRNVLGSLGGMAMLPLLFETLHAEDASANDTILVCIYMQGGNDGLNTVVPLAQYGQYYKLRTPGTPPPGQNMAYSLDDLSLLAFNSDYTVPPLSATEYAFAPSMLAMRDLYTTGKLAVVTGVGLPLAEINGLSYKLRFAPEPKRGDILVRSAGVAVLVDPRTALYLKGTQLDYSNQLIAGGFKFTNPNAKASCSCGESFSV